MPTIGNGAIGREEADRLASLLKVLASPSRLLILSVIIQGGADGGLMDAMMAVTRIQQSSVSNHLRKLEDEGFVIATTILSHGRRIGVWHIEPTALDKVWEAIESMGIRLPTRKP